jgi:hypothetical protein
MKYSVGFKTKRIPASDDKVLSGQIGREKILIWQ